MVPAHAGVALVFVVLGAAFMGALGLVAGIFSDKFDQMAAITNFVVTPLAFLSGTFYSVEALPPLLYEIIHWNPVFYLIDGLRWALIGMWDSAPGKGLVIVAGATAGVTGLAWVLFRTGYRLKP